MNEQFRNEFKSQKVNYDGISRTINKDGNDVEEINVTWIRLLNGICRNSRIIFIKEKNVYIWHQDNIKMMIGY